MPDGAAASPSDAPEGAAGASTGGASSGGSDGGVRVAGLAMFIMMDRSTSMITAPMGETVDSWAMATEGITDFVKETKSQGVDIGMGTFPVGSSNTSNCADGSDCGTPVVPIALLRDNGEPMIDAMIAQKPQSQSIALTPTECALRGMINRCLQFTSASAVGEPCVGVLVTDGAATQCDTVQQDLEAIIFDGKQKGVDTYVIGLTTTEFTALNGYAQAGGTGTAFDGYAGLSGVRDALEKIRDR
jgi:hypothetical protein